MYINRTSVTLVYIAEMNGVDAIVFTAGVGENDIPIRQEVADKLLFRHCC